MNAMDTTPLALATQFTIMASHGNIVELRKMLWELSFHSQHAAELVNKKDVFEESYTPLMLACRATDISLTRLLLQEGADVAETTEGGSTALWQACYHANSDQLQLLMQAASGLANSASLVGFTPLIMAAMAGREQEVALLLREPGVLPNQRDEFGKTALSYAQAYRHHGVEALLRTHGCS